MTTDTENLLYGVLDIVATALKCLAGLIFVMVAIAAIGLAKSNISH